MRTKLWIVVNQWFIAFFIFSVDGLVDFVYHIHMKITHHL